MANYSLRLHNEPFQLIVSGRKTIEVRLYDEKRQKITLGDSLTLINRDTSETEIVYVHGLLRYKSFGELFFSKDRERFGGKPVPELLQDIYKYYSVEDEDKYGALGIEISLDP